MKKKAICTYLFAMAIVFISSCEKVIDLKLDEASSALVIEGTVNNRIDTQVVRISRSSAITSQTAFAGVSGANVTVTDHNGQIYVFRERAPGIYSSRRLPGQPGKTYLLTVVYEDKEYKASSTMPSQTLLDSVQITNTTFFSEERKSVQVLYSDPPQIKNSYRFTLTINGIRSRDIFSFNDDFNDGNYVSREIFDNDVDLKSGDLVDIEMQCIDPFVYRYWQGLDQNQNRGGASITPANPVSNISNGALGYFSAHTQQFVRIEIP